MKKIIRIAIEKNKALFPILKMGIDELNYRDESFGAIIIHSYFDEYFVRYGVRDAHITIPETGEIHQTFIFNDLKKLHVFPNKINIQIPRELEHVRMLTKKLAKLLTHMSPRYNCPSFNDFDENTRVFLWTTAFSTENPLFIKKSIGNIKSENYDIVSINSLKGTVNITPFLSGNKNADDEKPNILKTITRHSYGLCYGVQILFIPSNPK
jgi:hypothetical protein